MKSHLRKSTEYPADDPDRAYTPDRRFDIRGSEALAGRHYDRRRFAIRGSEALAGGREPEVEEGAEAEVDVASYADMVDSEKLEVLASIEVEFYRDLQDAFREDFLINDADGNARDQMDVDFMRHVWSEARSIVLPRISFTEDTPQGMLRPTEWLLLFGQTGAGKSTLETYFAFWILDRNPWIKSIRSTMPIYAYSLYYPFVIRDDDGRRIRHPKLILMKELREIESYQDCLFLADELPSLMPGRNFMDRRQFAVTSMARNFRKQNVYVVATSQREKDPDPELRENFVLLIRPDVDEDSLTWKTWKNEDADYSYYAWHRDDYTRYPEFNPDEYPEPAIPWLFLAFDSRHKVPLEFQAPLTDEKAGVEAEALMSWIKMSDSGGVNSNYFSRGEFPPASELNAATKAWDVKNRRMYSGDEILLIAQEFRRLYFKIPEPEPESDPQPEAEAPREFACECGGIYTNQHHLDLHLNGVRNSILGLTNRPLSEARVEQYRRRHPLLVKRLEAAR